MGAAGRDGGAEGDMETLFKAKQQDEREEVWVLRREAWGCWGLGGGRQCEVKRKYLWFLNESENSPSALFALRTGLLLKEIARSRNNGFRCCSPQVCTSAAVNMWHHWNS